MKLDCHGSRNDRVQCRIELWLAIYFTPEDDCVKTVLYIFAFRFSDFFLCVCACVCLEREREKESLGPLTKLDIVLISFILWNGVVAKDYTFDRDYHGITFAHIKASQGNGKGE